MMYSVRVCAHSGNERQNGQGVLLAVGEGAGQGVEESTHLAGAGDVLPSFPLLLHHTVTHADLWKLRLQTKATAAKSNQFDILNNQIYSFFSQVG